MAWMRNNYNASTRGSQLLIDIAVPGQTAHVTQVLQQLSDIYCVPTQFTQSS